MQNADSPKGVPEPTDSSAEQSELAGQQAEIIHPDGSREIVRIVVERSWSGALPRPEDFGRFGEIVPDAPERILQMAEQEQQHRMAMERQLVPAEIAAGTRGQRYGTAISLIALILAAITAILDAAWQVSVALVAAPVLSVARSLVAAIRKAGD